MTLDSDEEKSEKNVRNFKKRMSGLLVLIIISTVSFSIAAGSFDIVPAGNVRIAVEPNGQIVGPMEAVIDLVVSGFGIYMIQSF